MTCRRLQADLIDVARALEQRQNALLCFGELRFADETLLDQKLSEPRRSDSRARLIRVAVGCDYADVFR